MKIFLSYGHDDNVVLVNKIRTDLEASKYNVWIDSTQIKAGDDWRRKIVQNLQACQKTLAILSAHSMREPGVCHDELVISMAARGEHSLVTVLVEDEDKVKPPLLVTHIQWVDMSNWREKRNQGLAVFTPWYEKRFEQIVDALESQHNYEGEIAELRRLLCISPTQATWVQNMTNLLQHGFVGREWIDKEIDIWLQEEVSLKEDNELGHKIFCLTAGPGMGKSALAAHIASRHQHHIAAVHFCKKTDTVQSILLSLAFQLGSRLPDYRQVLLHALKSMPTGKSLVNYTAEELFDFLLCETARMTVDGGRKRHAILLDGLDESEENLAVLLAQKALLMPRWLRVIITSRPSDIHVCSHLTSMYPHHLDVNDKRHQEDVHKWIDLWLTSRGIEYAKKVVHKQSMLNSSNGLFLYLSAFRDMVEEDPSLLEDPRLYPVGLSTLYGKYMERVAPNEEIYKNEIRPFMRFLAAVRKPLPISLAERLLHRQNPKFGRGSLKEDILPRLGSLVEIRSNTVYPFHESFTKWLSSPEAGNFRVNPLDGHAFLTEAMCMRILDAPILCLNWIHSFGRTELPYHLLTWLNNGKKYNNILQAIGLGREDSFLEANEVFLELDLGLEKFKRLQGLFEQEAQKKEIEKDFCAALDWRLCIVRMNCVLFGSEHLETAESMNNLAILLYSMDDYSPARVLFKRTLTVRKKILGMEHPLTAASFNNLAFLYYSLKKYNKAHLLFKKSLVIRQKVLGREHPATISSLSNLGLLLRALKDYFGARPLLSKAWTVRQKILGPEHDDTIFSLACLAKCLHDLGEYTEAMLLQKKALTLREKKYGPESAAVSNSLHNLAMSFEAVSKSREAQFLYKRALSIREKIYGPKDERTLATKKHLQKLRKLNAKTALYQLITSVQSGMKNNPQIVLVQESNSFLRNRFKKILGK